MKKLSTKLSFKSVTIVMAVTLLPLSGCVSPTNNANNPNGVTPVSTSVGIGRAIFQSAVDSKCRITMTNNKYWKTASLALPQTKQDEIQTSVCECVSAKAVKNVTPAELATAVIDQNARNQLVVTSVTESFNGCYGEIAKSLTFGK